MRVTLGFSGGAFWALLEKVAANSAQASRQRIAPRATGGREISIAEIYAAGAGLVQRNSGLLFCGYCTSTAAPAASRGRAAKIIAEANHTS